MVKIFHIKGTDEDHTSHPNSCDNVDKLNNYMNDNDAKIFMVVYRPSCPACQNFIPTWEQFENKTKILSLHVYILPMFQNLILNLKLNLSLILQKCKITTFMIMTEIQELLQI